MKSHYFALSFICLCWNAPAIAEQAKQEAFSAQFVSSFAEDSEPAESIAPEQPADPPLGEIESSPTPPETTPDVVPVGEADASAEPVSTDEPDAPENAPVDAETVNPAPETEPDPAKPDIAAEPESQALPITPDCSELAQRSQVELGKLQAYVDEANKRLEKLRQELNDGEKKRRQQEVVIESLQKHLDLVGQPVPGQNKLTSQVFARLAEQLPESPVFQVEDNRLVIMTDFILVFGRGEISTEGETRLQLIANALREAGQSMPEGIDWRWRVEGHSDSQPLRSITWFPSNWELSAARAAGVARYLIGQGIPAQRMRVAAFGATKPVEPDAQTKDEHWRNRRVEIHLVFEQG